MWNYGFLLAHNNQKEGVQLVEFRAQFAFLLEYLFRKMCGMGRMHVYKQLPSGKREFLTAHFDVSPSHFYEHGNIFLEPGEKLFMAFQGVKKKENALLASHVDVMVWGDEHIEGLRTRVERSTSPEPVDVFRC